MEFHERLKKLRKDSGITQVQMAQKLNLASQGAYRKYETGEGFPQLERLFLIAKIFNVTVGYLLGETNIRNTEINKIMEQLNKNRQEKTVSYAKSLLLEQNEEKKVIRLQNSLVPYEVEEEQALSAGRGEAYTVEYGKEIVYWDKDVKHDRAIVIRGNSMEPDYLYGQIALIKYQNSVDVPGEVYAVDDIDRGLAYIKSVFVEDGYLRLVSLNEAEDLEGNRLFPDILLPCDENTRIIGKVIAAFTPIDIKGIYY